MFRAPNNWRLGPNGSLIKDIETEEYKAAVVYLRELIEAGYMSPDVKSNVDLNNDLFAGKIVMRANAWNSYQGLLVDQAARLNQTYRIVPPFGHDGKAGAAMLGPGNFGWTAIKKASPDRVKELLSVLNYLAAPFGSEEFLVTKYGVKGEDWAYASREVRGSAVAAAPRARKCRRLRFMNCTPVMKVDWLMRRHACAPAL